MLHPAGHADSRRLGLAVANPRLVYPIQVQVVEDDTTVPAARLGLSTLPRLKEDKSMEAVLK